MYKTKKEVDAHVRTALSKIRLETERHLRSFTIAKLYYKVNEFSTAEQYLCSYLSIKEDNDQAHKLLGQCYQRLKKPDKALQSFQRSLRLNPRQSDILAEVCKMLLEDKNLNTCQAKYWCELAESEKVQHEAVFSLRLMLMNKNDLNTNQAEELIQKEISARPNDVQLRVRLLRNYVEKNKILDAFKYVHQLEMSQKDEFVSSSEWYNIVWLVLNKYEQTPNTKKDWDFWLLLTICLERQVQASFFLTDNSCIVGGGVTETANLLFNFDQYLFKISQLSDKLCAQKELIELFLHHYRGQLVLHATALIFKRELLQNKNKWKETTRAVLPLFMLAYQMRAPDINEPWMKHSDEQSKQLIGIWQREGSFRCAQAGRTLLSCVNDDPSADKENAHNINNLLGSHNTNLWHSNDELLEQVRQTCSDRQWRRNIFALLFCNSDQKVKEQSSLFATCSNLSEPLYELPTYADVEQYEDTAQYLKPQSLYHMVYLCLGNDNLSFVKAKYFSGLNFSTPNLSFCGAESLNQLDVDSFLYAATIQAKRALEVDRENFDNYQSGNSKAIGKPKMLPFVNIKHLLCSDEQADWWLAAYTVYKNLSNSNDLAELRANLQYGIEAIRGINGPKLDMAIVFKLGQLFVGRAQDIVKPIEKTFLEARAESIYKYGLNMMKMHNKGVLEPFRKYFKYAKSQTVAAERDLSSAAEDAVSYLAARYFKKSEYEDLIEELTGIQLPFATYLQAEAYRKLDEASKTPKKTKRMYLDRASDCLNQTLALLKNSAHADPNHPLNSVIHSEIKRLQQSSARYLNDSNTNYSPIIGHNNSSNYEDAEADFYAENSMIPPALLVNSRAKRETLANSNVLMSAHNLEMENLVKQMANTLTLLKDEIMDTLKPELCNVTKEISTLKDKISSLEDAMKKNRVSSNPPSRDDASNVLDDLYLIEDTIQQQLYQQQQQSSSNPPFGTNVGGVSNGPNIITNSPFMAQQQRLQAAAYNSPMFPPTHNYPINFYGHPNQPNPYIMPPQTGGHPINQRPGPLHSLPYLDPTVPIASTAINFNMPVTSTPLLPPPTQPFAVVPVESNRSSNLYNLLQQTPVSVVTNIGSIAQPPTVSTYPNTPITRMTSIHIPAPSTNTTTSINMTPTTTMQYHKLLNNQPVEKEAPANVVITSSDPLPNPNSLAIQSQQTPLSVTIPSHHIKSSLINQPSQSAEMASLTGKPITTTSTSNVFGVSIATSTFSFKPQIAAAAAQANNSLNDTLSKATEICNKTSESFGSDFNRSASEDVEYDPRPDFKAIIPLPDEIEVRTGEEDEEVLFCHRAKLFRYVDKEWKERGIGDIKILRNEEKNCRILMRRDQTHKICANHVITPELILNVPKKEIKGFIWAANDFADESLHLEKFFVRFKLPETAKQFEKIFKQAQKEANERSNANITKKNEKTQAAPFALATSSFTSFVTSTPAAQKNDGGVASQGKVVKAEVTTSTAAPTIAPISKSLFSGLNLSTKTTTAQLSTDKTTTTATSSPFSNLTFKTSSTTESPFASIFNNLSNLPILNKATEISTADVIPTTVNETISASSLNKSTASDNEDEYVPTAQFNPVIPLPDLIEVNTGEENEIILFEHRAKLLRFDKEAGEWKERGLGNIKLLQDEHNVNKVRLVMRREQIHKLCCNQRVYKDTAFKYSQNSKTALFWAGQDYSDNELVTVMLTVRFKLPETCAQFFEAVQNAQAKMSDVGEDPNSKVNEKCVLGNTKPSHCLSWDTPKDGTVPKMEAKSNNLTTNSESKFKFGCEPESGVKTVAGKPSFKFETTTTALTITAKSNGFNSTASGFGNSFKPKAGSWNCQDCYLSNDAETLYCKACEAPKDDTVPKKQSESNILTLSNPSQKFNFGFGSQAMTVNTNTSFTFTPPSATSTTLTSTTPASEIAPLGKPTFAFSLSSKALESPVMPGASGESKAANTFTLDKKEFSFILKPKSPGKIGKSPLKFGGGDADVGAEDDTEGQYPEEEENNTYFTPVIPLPDKIEVKTGEEDEDLLYVHRAKLYRFIDGEWKERGLGNVKILSHKETKNLRVVMRREQILKICLNHVLNNNVDYKRKDDKSWLFVVNDFSDGAVELEKFSLRFKTKELAEEFMVVVKKALDGNVEVIEPLGDTSRVTPTNIQPPPPALAISAEDRILAAKLNLPYEFFRTKQDCTGCRGCDSDNFLFADIKNTDAFVNKDDIQNPLDIMELPVLNLNKTSENNRTFLKQSVLSLQTTKIKDWVNSAFEGTNNSTDFVALPAATEKPASTFSFTSALSSTAKPAEEITPFATGGSGFLFGSTTSSARSNISADKGMNIFGQKPVMFGEAANTDSNTNNLTNLSEKTAPKPSFSGAIFGGKTAFGSSVPAFGGISLTANGTSKSIFGNSGNAIQGEGNGITNSILSTSTNAFGGFNTQGSILSPSLSTLPEFGSLSKDAHATTFADLYGETSPTSLADLSNTTTASINFASLAKTGLNTGSQAIEATQKPGPEGFIGLTNHNAFASFAKSPRELNTSDRKTSSSKPNESQKSIGAGDEGGDSNDENYDPHYDPVIALPNEIVVSTGEEDETKLFGERAVLYRYDSTNKEWKERGIGELKILLHRTKESYRLVMRREQIHKLVLNHAINADFCFSNMNNNPQSFVWATLNYAETNEGELEKLAVRFKKLVLAEAFKKQLKECIENCKARQPTN